MSESKELFVREQELEQLQTEINYLSEQLKLGTELYNVLADDLSEAKEEPQGEVGRKNDDNKIKYSLIPPVALESMAIVLTMGADEYGVDNWKQVSNSRERYLDALYRHLEAYRAGQTFDEQSGENHMAHIMCNASFMIHFDEENECGR